MPREPFLAEVFPLGIHGHDQRHLPNPQQALDLFLAGDGGVDVTEALEIDQAVDLIAGCEFAFDALLVLEDASLQISRRMFFTHLTTTVRAV